MGFGILVLSCYELHAMVLMFFQTVDAAMFLGGLRSYLEIKPVAGDSLYKSMLLK